MNYQRNQRNCLWVIQPISLPKRLFYINNMSLDYKHCLFLWQTKINTTTCVVPTPPSHPKSPWPFSLFKISFDFIFFSHCAEKIYTNLNQLMVLFDKALTWCFFFTHRISLMYCFVYLLLVLAWWDPDAVIYKALLYILAPQYPGEQQIAGAQGSARLSGSHPLRAWDRLQTSQKPNLLPLGTSRSQRNRASSLLVLSLFSSQLTVWAQHVLDIWEWFISAKEITHVTI